MKNPSEQTSFLRTSEHGVSFDLGRTQVSDVSETAAPKGEQQKEFADWDKADQTGYSRGMTAGQIQSQFEQANKTSIQQELEQAIRHAEGIVRNGSRVSRDLLRKKLEIKSKR